MTRPIADCSCGTCLTCTAAPPERAVVDPRTFRHGAIRARLLSRISSSEVEGNRPLDALGTRDDDDPTIALVDAYAGALHVLAWNAARLSDDGSIRRTEDRDALVDLTRLLGYEARPAIAATTTLAFTVDAIEGAKSITIPRGTKVASVPVKDEKPQVFETDAGIEARVEWNEVLPAQVQDIPSINLATKTITIARASTVAKPGDIVIASLKSWINRDFEFVNVSPRPSLPGQIFVVTIELVGPAPAGGLELQLSANPSDLVTFSGGGTLVIPAGQTQAVETGTVTGPQGPQQITVSSARDSETVDLWSVSPRLAWLCARVANVTRKPDLDPPRTVIELASQFGLPISSGVRAKDVKEKVVILGERAAAFGAGAPDMALMPSDVRTAYGETDSAGKPEWKNLEMPSGGTTTGGSIDLDAVHPDAIGGRLVAFAAGTTTQLGQITGSTELSRRGFGLAAKVTRISVTGIDLTATTGFAKKVRDTAIYIETSRDVLLVVDKDVALPGTPSDRIVVQGNVTLPVGRRIVLSGEQWTSTPGAGPRVAEVAVLKSSAVSGGNTLLVFESPLTNTFQSTTLKVLANAVAASHGETTPASGAEPLGSGNASRPSPTFTLKRPPLAYVPADNLRGYAPAIEVRVDDRLYKEAPTLFGLGSEDRAYAVTTSREGTSQVQFAGRLPSGAHNVTARYRTGGGTAGNLDAGRLTMVMAPVLGAGKVTNPVSADGASDAEDIESLRTAAPRSIRTLGRVVSLEDFEAFARTYRGVGKALATELQVRMRKVVALTIATTTLAAPGADLVKALKDALANVSVPGRIVRVEGFTDLTANLTIALAIDPTRTRANVESAVRAKLVERFGREARRFGEALHRSAVIAAVHEVDSIIAARLTTFVRSDGAQADAEGRLLCPIPAIVNGMFVKAGLLSVYASGITLAEMTP